MPTHRDQIFEASTKRSNYGDKIEKYIPVDTTVEHTSTDRDAIVFTSSNHMIKSSDRNPSQEDENPKSIKLV